MIFRTPLLESSLSPYFIGGVGADEKLLVSKSENYRCKTGVNVGEQ